LFLSPDLDGSKWTPTPLQEPGQPENVREISDDANNRLAKSGLMFGNPNMLQCRSFGSPTALKPNPRAVSRTDLVRHGVAALIHRN
jgi:hypothetical protein